MRALLCDLDDTLFDHQQATRSALETLRTRDARLQAWPLEELKRRHHELLERFHLEVMAGRLSIDEAREQRFSALVGGGDASDLAQAYRDAYMEDWREVAGAAALLRLARASGVPVVVVTNNIVSEQRKKLDRIGMTHLVDALITSEEVGIQKPDPQIFKAALDAAGVGPADAVMLGDAWQADVLGARASQIRPVWLNRHGLPLADDTVDVVTGLVPRDDVYSVICGERRSTSPRQSRPPQAKSPQ